MERFFCPEHGNSKKAAFAAFFNNPIFLFSADATQYVQKSS